MKERYLPIDLLRGLTIILMIIVNMPGSWSHIYAPLRHAGWHGCTLADLVFPLFLFITGYSMAFSMTRSGIPERRGAALPRAVYARILRRCVLIFAAGLLLNIFPFDTPPPDIRIMGVLQRISIAWGIAALLVLFLDDRKLLFVAVGTLAAYYSITLYFGGPDPWSLEGNLAVRIDTLLLGKAHMWDGFGVPFDPEGILTTFPAVVSVLAGYLAGGPAARGMSTKLLLKRYLSIGTALGAGGLLLGYHYPINKPLWTGSYVLLTAGISIVLMALCVWITQVRRWRKWTGFAVVFGMNPLFAFVLSSLWARTLSGVIKIQTAAGPKSGYSYLYTEVFRPVPGEMNGSLAFSIFHVILFWAILLLLHRRRIVLKA